MYGLMVVFKKLVAPLFVLSLAGCQSFHPEPLPPYSGIPQEISTNQTSGLQFVKTVTFGGVYAEDDLQRYAERYNYRYYVVLGRHYYRDRNSSRDGKYKSDHDFFDMGRLEKIRAMIYR